MGRLHSSAEVRALERLAIDEYGIPGFTLMRRAGQAAFDLLRSKWPRARAVWTLCGTGNNGGDGYVVAALAREAGLEARTFHLGDPTRLRGEAAQAFTLARQRGVVIMAFDSTLALPGPGTVLVDALLGIGVQGEVRTDCRAAIDWLSRCKAPVLALDLPSGLCADTGAVLGAAVKADATITFLGYKTGLAQGAGPAHAGTIHLDLLGVPPTLLASAGTKG